MKSIRKFVYAVVLTLSALNFAPILASAQDEAGTFTLPHEVLWQNATVPAGDYRFTLQPVGPSEMLTLRKLSGTPESFMLMVNDTDVADSSKTASLVINSKFGERYVSAMNLPQFEVTLHFAAPANSGKEVAEMHTASAASSAQ
ncbi:MAG: hypothetical protein WBP65_20325 [Candidatus Sulfotelmatobacter sp.]|jgi:hypothetical protein